MNFSNSIYSEEHIENEIKKAMVSLGLSRMPSNSETKIATGSQSLSNLICRTGGYYYWAKKLNLETKNSETKTGVIQEIACCNFLNSIGLKSELTAANFPYDILCEQTTKIDVKISNGYLGKIFFFAFNIETNMPRSDFYVFYCFNEKMNKVLIVPSHVLCGIKQVSIGLKSKYDKYIDRWDLIEKHVFFMKSIKQ